MTAHSSPGSSTFKAVSKSPDGGRISGPSGRTLLAGVAERGVQDVFDGLVAIGKRGDNRCVLAAGLGEEIQSRIIAEHGQRGFGAARENDGVDFGVID
jgi:hypothetical protein